MPASFAMTTRNGLRYMLGTDLVSDVDEGFQRLAEDVDTKMASYSQDTLAKRPPAGQPNRTFKATDTGVIYLDTGAAWSALDWPGKLAFAANVTLLDGYLACDGSAVSRSTYALLFANIGTQYGVGNGSTTFNLPDYRERTPVGPGGSTPFASKGGEATHKLLVAESASHTHALSVSYHAENGGGAYIFLPPAGWGGMLGHVIGGGGTGGDFNVAGEPGGGIAASAASSGGGEAHNNREPYTVCNVWIKVL